MIRGNNFEKSLSPELYSIAAGENVTFEEQKSIPDAPVSVQRSEIDVPLINNPVPESDITPPTLPVVNVVKAVPPRSVPQYDPDFDFLPPRKRRSPLRKILGIVIFILLIICAVFVWRKFKTPSDSEQKSEHTNTTVQSSTSELDALAKAEDWVKKFYAKINTEATSDILSGTVMSKTAARTTTKTTTTTESVTNLEETYTSTDSMSYQEWTEENQEWIEENQEWTEGNQEWSEETQDWNEEYQEPAEDMNLYGW